METMPTRNMALRFFFSISTMDFEDISFRKLNTFDSLFCELRNGDLVASCSVWLSLYKLDSSMPSSLMLLFELCFFRSFSDAVSTIVAEHLRSLADKPLNLTFTISKCELDT